MHFFIFTLATVQLYGGSPLKTILKNFYNKRIAKELGNLFEENVSTCIYNIRRHHLLPFPIIAAIISLEMTSLQSNVFQIRKRSKELFYEKLLGVIIRCQI